MKTSPAGIALIEQFEGCRLQAYQDGNGIWTIGYGHAAGEVHAGQFETKEQAEADLCADLGTAELAVSRMVHAPLNQNQFDALVSFTYNEGSGRLLSSTLLKLVNAGSYSTAAEWFPKWDIVDGQPSAGLLRRRLAEQALFIKSVAGETEAAHGS